MNVISGIVTDDFDALSGGLVNLLGVELLLDKLVLSECTLGETLAIRFDLSVENVLLRACRERLLAGNDFRFCRLLAAGGRRKQ